MVIVDTSVFSLFLRREQQLTNPYLSLFTDLFQKDMVVLLGVVYQETLSGIRYEEQFERLADILAGFEVELATMTDHLLAAQYYNQCCGHGVQGSSIDFLICAMAVQRDCSILTTDNDFRFYANYLPITILSPIG